MKRRKHDNTPRPFRATATPGEALALDPGGGGLIAAAMRGKQPSPQAFGATYPRMRAIRFLPEPLTTSWGQVIPSSIDDGVAVLRVCGPLEHHAGWWWDSYEDIVREVGAALDHEDVRAVVLRIDSPGGVAAGMGECHRALRKMQKRTGKPVYAFADEMACSAAYHLAAACREVWTTRAGHVGSVGVILCTVDETERLEKDGIKVRYLVTGARKADMHPGNAVTDDVLAAAQAKVDKLGRQFFIAVAKARAGTPTGAKLADPKAVRALQAGVFLGDDAVAAGLADGVASWERFLSYVKSVSRAMGMTDQSVSRRTGDTKEAKMPKAKTKIPALGAVAADEKTAKKARGMIASALALLGIGGDAKADTAAKYSKKTETTKHTIVEEDDSDDADAEADSDGGEDAEDSETDMTEDSEAEEEDESSAAEEEEESGSGGEEDEEEEGDDSEEEEASALTRSAVKAAFAAADKAFIAALPKDSRASAGIRTPSRLLRAAKRATGRSGIDGIMGALSAMPVAAKANEKIRADLARIDREMREDKIGSVIAKAKAEGRAGATSREGRASLRAIGQKHGVSFLRAHVATLPKLTTKAKAPKIDAKGNPIGAPTSTDQKKMAEQAMAGLSAEERKAYAEIEAEKSKSANGAGKW